MTRKARGRDLLVMGPEPHFAHCTRCGKPVDKPEFPLSIPAFMKFVAYVGALHDDCAPVAEPAEVAAR